MTAGKCLVCLLLGTNVGNDMDVSSAAIVVTGEHSLELCHTIGIGLLNTAQEGLVEVGSIVAVTVHATLNTRVDTGGVAVPDIPVEVLDRFAGVDIDELSVENDRDSILTVPNVRADELTLHPERSCLTFGGKDADRVLGEQLRLGGVRGNIEGGMVGGVHHLIGVTGNHTSLVIFRNGCGTASFGTGVDSPALQMIRAQVQTAFGILEEGLLRQGVVGGGLMDTGVANGQSGHGKES